MQTSSLGGITGDLNQPRAPLAMSGDRKPRSRSPVCREGWEKGATKKVSTTSEFFIPNKGRRRGAICGAALAVGL